MTNEINMRFLSKKENIGIIRNMIGTILALKDTTLSFINETKVMVSEAITNAIVHGYQGREDETVELNIKYDDEEISFIILDNGIGIADVELAREPLYSSKKDDERSGLGFTIMEMFCDKFEVFSEEMKGTKIILTKRWQ